MNWPEPLDGLMIIDGSIKYSIEIMLLILTL